MLARLCVLLALLCVGCKLPDVPSPPNPEPDIPVAAGTITAFESAAGSALRATYLETADKLDAGQLKTAEAMIADESARFDAAFDKAAQAIANREQKETNTGGKWTPPRASEWRKKMAREP